MKRPIDQICGVVDRNSRHEFKRADNEPVIMTYSKDRRIRIDSRENGIQVAVHCEAWRQDNKQSQPARTNAELHDGN